MALCSQFGERLTTTCDGQAVRSCAEERIQRLSAELGSCVARLPFGRAGRIVPAPKKIKAVHTITGLAPTYTQTPRTYPNIECSLPNMENYLSQAGHVPNCKTKSLGFKMGFDHCSCCYLYLIPKSNSRALRPWETLQPTIVSCQIMLSLSSSTKHPPIMPCPIPIARCVLHAVSMRLPSWQ